MARRDRRLLRHARAMRRDPTPAERRLWRELRRGRLEVRFRRQEPIGPFIVDFVSHTAGLVVEVDGDSHDHPARDATRERWLVERGYRVVRFFDSEVYEDLDGVVERIWREVH